MTGTTNDARDLGTYGFLPPQPDGGVGLADVEPYLEVGAIGVGVGGPLVGDAASGGDLEALRERARAYLAVAERFPA
jgi:2-dehydro-3-deoxyphosphogluconate aldolase/(4S)-4-hydroxy-2-oxoglutarate aldolase